MTHPTGSLPNETYADSLLDADEGTLHLVYQEFRPPFLRALTAAGVSENRAGLLFQTALVDAARLLAAGIWAREQPFYPALLQLGLAHARRLQADPAAEADSPEPARADSFDDFSAEIPAPEALAASWDLVNAWKAAPPADPPADPALFALWQASERLERQHRNLPPDHKPEPRANRIWRYSLLALAVFVLGQAVYTWLVRPQTPHSLFDTYFNAPESFAADRQARGAIDSLSLTYPVQAAECDHLLRQADRLSQEGHLEEAQEPLLLLALDSTGVCQSDAWYFLGLLRLKMGDPETAIQCLTKIEDYERYGDDLQWNMALAFVQLAEKDPGMRERAARAVERVMNGAQTDARREQARKLLENLNR